MMGRLKEKLTHIKMPHTYVILTGILLAVVVMTYLIPAGQYDRVLDAASGKMVVLPESFHFVEGKQPGLFDIFLALQRGYVSAADILFLIVFAYGYVYMLTKNGTLNNSINVLVRRMGSRTHLLIPVCMMIFGLLGATLGIFEEVYGLVSVFIGIAVALGYDPLVGGAVVYVGVATGSAAAITNPFSVGIAQSIAEVPLNSGVGYRLVIFFVFQAVSIWYVMRYAKKVKAHPEQSILYGSPDIYTGVKPEESDFSLRQKLCLLLFFVTIGTLLIGTTEWDWYIDEIAAMFLMMMVLTGIVSGYSATEICQLHRVHQVCGFLHSGHRLYPWYPADHAGGHDLRHHRIRLGQTAEYQRQGVLRRGHALPAERHQLLYHRFLQPGHHHHAHHGSGGRHRGHQPPDGGAGLLLRRRLLRYVLAHRLRSGMRPDGDPHQQVV